MENVSFTFEDAQRIADAVTTVERSKFLVKPGSLENQSDELVVIYVTATTKFQDGTQNGNLSYWDETNHNFAQYSPTQTVRVRDANTTNTLPVGFVFARFQGITNRQDDFTTGGPLYIAIGSASSKGGNATIEVVTDVVCTPTGLQVQTAQFSGKDYDTAVIRQFLSLTDVTPVSYLGMQNRLVKVNSSATALEFGLNAGTLESDISTIKSNIASLQASLVAINASITDIQADIVTLQNQMIGALANIASAQNNITTAQNDIASLLTRVYALEHP